MPDYANNSSTTGTLSVGSSVTSDIENYADRGDWFAIPLQSGIEYQFTLSNYNFFEGTIAIYDGREYHPLFTTYMDSLAFEFFQLINSVMNGSDRLSYTPTATGTYYVEVGGMANWPGTYTLSASESNSSNSGSSPSDPDEGQWIFASATPFTVGHRPKWVASGDLNHDGHADLAVANYNSDTVSVLLGNGDGAFQNQITYPVGGAPRALALGDLNGDSTTDLAVANGYSDSVSILLNNGDGTFEPQATKSVGDSPLSIAAGDLNGDSVQDLVTANANSDNVSVLIGIGNGSFASQVTYSVGDMPSSVVMIDLNRDGHLDLVTANANSGNLSVLLGEGDGTFQNQTTVAVDAGPQALAAGDMNGDGNADLAVANYDSDTVSILLSHGDGTLQAMPALASGDSPNEVALGDLDGDGTIDLVAANLLDYTVSVWLGQGDGSFQDQGTVSSGDYPEGISLGDLDGNGTLDLAVANDGPGPSAGINSTVSVLLNTHSSASSSNNSGVATELVLNTPAGAALALLYAGFDALPDPSTFGHWIQQAENLWGSGSASPMVSLAQAMLDYYAPDGVPNEALITLLYTNIVGTAPESSVIDEYSGLIDQGTYTQASLLALAAELELNTSQYGGLVGQGLEYTVM